MTGFLLAQRARFEHHLFAREKFCRGYAWDWMVAKAAFRDTTVSISGKTITLKRGQLSYSIRYLAEAWNWDKAAVSRFIARLKTETMVETDTETGQIIITICNYERYQSPDRDTETATETPSETPARQQRDSSETNKKELKTIITNNPAQGMEGETPLSQKIQRRSSPMPPEQPFETPDRDADLGRFSEFWAAYPLKENKSDAEGAWIVATLHVSPDRIIASAKAYAAAKVGTEDKFLTRPANWLSKQRWTDELRPAQANAEQAKRVRRLQSIARGFGQ